MGKASRKKQGQRSRKASAPVPATAVEQDPQDIGSAALARLLRSNDPGKPSLAAAYAHGYMTLGLAQRQDEEPSWFREVDPLDALFLGVVFPETFANAQEFANARDAWLRLLRGSVHGKNIERFVREAVAASAEMELAVDDGRLMLALAGRLEAAGLDQRSLPRRLMPQVALQGCRAVFGPNLDLPLPDMPKDAKEHVKRFWKSTEEKTPWASDTPAAILRMGLHRLQGAGMPVKKEPALLLPALYAALLAKPGEMFPDVVDHACAWALSLDEGSSLLPVLDVLLIAPEQGISVTDVLGRLFALPAFTDPIPSEALLWTSSPGLALPRIAFELGIEAVLTLDGEITPDLLDWTGMHNRMHLSDSARQHAQEPEGLAGMAEAPEVPDEAWAERREAVREAVQHKLAKKKSTDPVATQRSVTGPIERVWNADGSSVIRIPTVTAHGQLLMEGLEGQLAAFREKFGREPEPNDPLFFDPDADEPTRLRREYVDDMLLEFAERAPAMGIDPAYFHAWRELGYVVSEENRSMFTVAEVITFQRAVARHRETLP
jgi:hypothetical protein